MTRKELLAKIRRDSTGKHDAVSLQLTWLLNELARAEAVISAARGEGNPGECECDTCRAVEKYDAESGQ